MRYIRTKDNIIDLRRFGNMPCGVANYMGKVVYDFNAYGRFVAEQEADAIGGLCDEFVLTDNGNTPLIIHNVVELDSGIFENVKTLKTQYKKIYGAIWTEWGLKYVAKMNEEGDLELL